MPTQEQFMAIVNKYITVDWVASNPGATLIEALAYIQKQLATEEASRPER